MAEHHANTGFVQANSAAGAALRAGDVAGDEVRDLERADVLREVGHALLRGAAHGHGDEPAVARVVRARLRRARRRGGGVLVPDVLVVVGTGNGGCPGGGGNTGIGGSVGDGKSDVHVFVVIVVVVGVGVDVGVAPGQVYGPQLQIVVRVVAVTVTVLGVGLGGRAVPGGTAVALAAYTQQTSEENFFPDPLVRGLAIRCIDESQSENST